MRLPSSSKLWEGIANPDKAVNHVSRKIRKLVDRTRIRLVRTLYANDGIYVMDEDWDNLILLDACRFDVFEQVNTLDGNLRCVLSRGGSTHEFIEENFGGRSFHDTVFVSSNAVVGVKERYIDVFKLVGLWGDERRRDISGEDDLTDPLSVTDPEPVVERSKELAERHPDKRLLVHLLPPHTPFLVKGGERLSAGSEYRTYNAVRRGEVSREEIRRVYVENVEFVMDYVEELVDALDGKTVVSADHGELLGEGVPFLVQVLHPRWSFTRRRNFDYGHYDGVKEAELIRVPWLEIEGDERRRVTETAPSSDDEFDESSIDEQLEALGYK